MLVGMLNGTDVLSNPDGKLGLVDGSVDCCRGLSCEMTLGPIDGKKLS